MDIITPDLRHTEERNFTEWAQKQTPAAQLGIITRLQTALQIPQEEPPAQPDTISDDTVLAEAEAIQTFSRIIACNFDNLALSRDEAQALYSALFGLNILIETHFQHTQDFIYNG